ncbi:hypothetical protein GCM10023342_06110 [Modicisalibacter zincidurans]|uniref:Uncharacterized protein n=1 Tax=Modicisalibacter zincidurans TaxID=1178777 RepID=A0ABP9R4E0_9GAMM
MEIAGQALTAPAHVANRLGYLYRLLAGVTVVQRNIIALLRQVQRKETTDAGRSAGNKCGLTQGFDAATPGSLG